MKNVTLIILILLSSFGLSSFAQCDADYTVILNNFDFVPSELTISPGETVAFVNIEGEHTLNGINNSITNEPFNNPFEIFLEQTTGNSAGVCMGIVTFDTAGVFNFDCSVGYNAQAGMTLSIEVDAFDLNDLMINMYSEESLPIFKSYYAFNSFCDTLLSQSGPWTVFVPNEEAVNEILEYMNLNEYDALVIPDFKEILEYHFAEGNWLAEDLYDGLQLPTAQGQSLNVSQNEQGTYVNGAKVTNTNYEAYNGVIHIIDYCLAPQGLPESTVMEIIRQSDSHQLFEEAIISVALDDDLSVQAPIDDSIDGPGPWTVFAPTDLAFEILAEEMGLSTDELLSSQFLYDIVNNHIVNYQIFGEDMYSGNVANTLEGEQIEFEYTDSVFYIIGEQNTVEIIVQDLYAYNGVVHVIDAVIKPFIPDLEGTCGVWRTVLQTNTNNGWGGNELYLYVNNQFVESLTIFNGSEPRTYEFGVDIGDEIDLYFNQNGGSGSSYKLFNGEGELIVNATNSNYGLASHTNIIACETFGEDYCGKIKVDLFSDFGGGWYGSLDVYRNGVFDQDITMPIGYKQTSFINSNYNDSFDFIVNNPAFPEETGYIISNINNQVVLDENQINLAPENNSNVLFCETTTSGSSWNCVNDACVDLEDNTGLFNTLSECQKTCGNSTSINELDSELSIYPNPSKGMFNIRFEGKKDQTIEISIINYLGQIVFFEELKDYNGRYKKPINLGKNANGIYQLRIKTNNEILSRKIVVQ